jgi:hypothetical protein
MRTIWQVALSGLALASAARTTSVAAVSRFMPKARMTRPIVLSST